MSSISKCILPLSRQASSHSSFDLGIQQTLKLELVYLILPPGDAVSGLIFCLSARSTKRQGQLTFRVTKPCSYFGAKLTFWQQHPECRSSSVFCPSQIYRVVQPDVPSDCGANIWCTRTILACCSAVSDQWLFFWLAASPWVTWSGTVLSAADYCTLKKQLIPEPLHYALRCGYI